MRTAVISDIHGNLEAFTSVRDDIQSPQVDRIVSLGDNIGYGADSENVVQLLIAKTDS
jgi:predicted phosphodiesterase